jgi:hypothetical protein
VEEKKSKEIKETEGRDYGEGLETSGLKNRQIAINEGTG